MSLLYSYLCPACGWTTEVFRKVDARDSVPPRCDFCGLNFDVPMRRELSSVAVRDETVSRP